MILPGVAALGGGVFLAAAMLAQDIALVLVLLCGSAILYAFWYGPVYSAVQGAAPKNARATATAVHLFVSNILGFGLGPTFIGALSDLYNYGMMTGTPLGAAEGLRWAIATASAATIPAAALFFFAARQIDLRPSPAQPQSHS